jgi:5-methylcytosine-specific restriction endonuclease McrA
MTDFDLSSMSESEIRKLCVPQPKRKAIRKGKHKKSRVGKVGIVRLYGKDLEKLRRECFERDNYTCVECGTYVEWSDNELYRGYKWRTPVGHMAHIRTKRNNGDTLDNVRTLCAECHQKEHNAGGKPVPGKKRI